MQGYEADVRATVEEYVHPLVGYDGDGWPFSRTLSENRLRAQVETVDAIDQVSDITITAHGGTVTENGQIQLSETALFAIESVSVDVTAPVRKEGD